MWPLLFIVIFLGVFWTLRKWVFATFLGRLANTHNLKVKKQKLEMFEQLKSIVSCDPILKAKQAIRILEIGAGSGANFEFYPQNCHLVVVEPNSFFQKILTENVLKYPGIKMENYVVKKAEEITNDDIAFESFDAVVSTIVFCSVDNLSVVYDLVKNALTPGGRYLFLEHCLLPSSAWFHYIQRILDFTGIWGFFFDGCNLSRQLDKIILQQGFTDVKANTFYIDTSGTMGFWNFIQLHVYGVAVK